MDIIWIVKADYISEHKLMLEFNDGVRGIVDLKNALDTEIFHPLNDERYFRNFELNDWTINWPNGADFAPEYLYNLAKKDQLMLVKK